MYLALTISGILLFVFLFFYILERRKKQLKNKTQIGIILSDRDRERLAFHESGHAIVYAKLFGYKSLYLVTINPNEKEFGSIQYSSNGGYNQNINELISLIAVSLAGSVSERFFLKEKTTSIIHDLTNANFIAFEMVSKFGMGKTTGLFRFENINDVSEEMKSRVENDILVLLKKAEYLASNIISEEKYKIIKLKDLLLKKNTLTTDDLYMFFCEFEN